MTEKLTIMLDASALKGATCINYLFNTVVIGYREKGSNNDTEWGSAFHKFRYIFRDKGLEAFPIACITATKYFKEKEMYVKPTKKFLTDVFLQQAMLSYATRYKNDPFEVVRVPKDSLPNDMQKESTENSVPLLEQYCQFAFPVYIDDSVEILIAGTIDEINKHRTGNMYSFCDCKTSGTWKRQYFFRSFEVNPQLILYRWVIQQYGINFPNSIFGKMLQYDISCFIDGVFYDNKEVTLQRSDVWIIGDNTLKEFEMLLKQQIDKLVYWCHEFIKNPSVAIPREGIINGACNTNFKECIFLPGCINANNRETYRLILDNNLIKKHYNPLEFGA